MTVPSDSPVAILIVDDDPDFPGLLQDLLATIAPSLPAETRVARSAAAATAELRARSYDLVLLDQQLPGGTGLEVLAATRELPLPRQPAVIMLTAAGSEELAVEAMKKGAKDYLSKLDMRLPVLHRAMVGALERQRLERQLHEKTAQWQADLRMARDVQRAFLPQRYPSFPPGAAPAESRLRFCHRYQPAVEVGGDFFDVWPVSDTAAGVLICDVMGHGLRAALVTAILRGLVEELMPVAADPGQFLTDVNRGLEDILRQTRPPLFASAFYLVADLARGELRYANAGHPPPLRVQRRRQQVELLWLDHTAANLALGVEAQQRYPTQRAHLEAGDCILLYTDGLVEARGEGDALFGDERLREAVRRHAGLTTDELCDELLVEVRAFSARHEFADDVCLVGLDVAAEPPRQ